MSQRLAAVLCAFLFVGLAVGVAPATTYNLTALAPLGTDTLTAAYSVAYVNGAPEAVGFSRASGIGEPVSWSSSGVATNLLNFLPAAASKAQKDWANFIDANGDIAGQVYASSSATVTSAFYIPAGATGHSGYILPTLGGTLASAALGCNSLGDVVGYAGSSDGDQHAFVWTASGGIVDLGSTGVYSYATAISADGNTIVGVSGTNYEGANTAVEWTNSGTSWTMSVLIPPANYAGGATAATAMNSSGTIVGVANVAKVPSPPAYDALYVPSGGSAVDLGFVNATAHQCWPRAISDSGVIVGNDSNTPWVNYNDTAAGMTVINSSLLAPGQGTGWTFQEAYGIDDNGDIVMYSSDNASGKLEACMLTPTPEPSALLLAVGGLAGLLAYAWRKRK